ncbi:MAG: hypothetical protein U1F76_14205 [Candidatus Competibacteraceae bacterium]
MESILIILLGLVGIHLAWPILEGAGRLAARIGRVPVILWQGFATSRRLWQDWRRRHQRQPPAVLTAPPPDWTAQERPTWRRREQPFPALARLAPPPELTAPLPDWTAQERPTWQRRGQPFPTLAPATVAAPLPLTSDPVIF